MLSTDRLDTQIVANVLGPLLQNFFRPQFTNFRKKLEFLSVASFQAESNVCG